MVSQITLCSATSLARGRRVAAGCTISACVDGHTYEYVPVTLCMRDAESRMGPKVVGILLEGEKYEQAAESLPTACVRDRIERKRA